MDFSILVPTFNRPVQLTACLAALADLDYPRDQFEVILVDDGSPEPVEPVAEPFRGRLDVVVLRQRNAGPSAARNLGATHARGQWLAFTDDDCQPDPAWLGRLALVLKDGGDCVVGGRTINGLPDNLCSTMSQLIVEVVYRHYNAQPDQAQFFATNNLAMGRLLYTRLGGLNEAFATSEDRDLCDRCLAAGVRLRYAPEAVVQHRHALSVRDFCRQHFSYGRGAFRFHRAQLARGSGHPGHKVHFHLDYRNWVLYPFTQVPSSRWPGVAALLACWQMANLAGFVAEGIRPKNR
jgi:glycosyltransferase involved in cell wall biosynthesis